MSDRVNERVIKAWSSRAYDEFEEHFNKAARRMMEDGVSKQAACITISTQLIKVGMLYWSIAKNEGATEGQREKLNAFMDKLKERMKEEL